MRILYIASMVSLVSVSAPAIAADGKDGKYNPDKVVCKSVRLTGSRLPGERVCMTRKQWDEKARAAQKDTQETLNDAHGGAVPRPLEPVG